MYLHSCVLVYWDSSLCIQTNSNRSMSQKCYYSKPMESSLPYPENTHLDLWMTRDQSHLKSTCQIMWKHFQHQTSYNVLSFINFNSLSQNKACKSTCYVCTITVYYIYGAVLKRPHQSIGHAWYVQVAAGLKYNGKVDDYAAGWEGCYLDDDLSRAD